jgi:hypothetical protein
LPLHARARSNALNVAVEWRFTGASNVTIEGNFGEPGDIFCWLEFLGNLWSPYWDILMRRIFDAWTAIAPDGVGPKVHWCGHHAAMLRRHI